MRFFWQVNYAFKHLVDEILIKIKHPKRECDIKYYVYGIFDLFIFHPWYCLTRGITNLFRWFKLIWSIDVFDQEYLYDLMDKQLEQMEIFWKSNYPNSCGKKHKAKRIAWTRKLYNLHKEEYYVMKHYDEFHNFNYLSTGIKSNVVKYDEFGVAILSQIENKFTDEQAEIYREGSNRAYEMQEKVWNLYIKNFSRSREWWD